MRGGLRFALVLIAVWLALFASSGTASADGWIIPRPPVPPCPNCPPVPPRDVPYLTVKYHRVTVTIEDQVAVTRVDQVFVNRSEWSLEGTYVFPLPEEASISRFAMWVDGEPLQGELYAREEARRIYEEIVRQRLDPALLEYVGRDLFQASIFPIEPGGERRIEIEYVQALPADNGLVRYVYPLSTERFSPEPLGDVSISVDIESDVPIRSLYSPSHPVAIDRQGQKRARVGWEARDLTPHTDFALYYTVSPESPGVNLLSYRGEDREGYFALLITPALSTDEDEVVEKDVVLVLDVSGSMEGEKLEQAKEALTYVLRHLNDGDRYNVIAFSTEVTSLARTMQPAGNLREAERFVAGLQARGNTDINGALLEAMALADPERPTIVIFLTDGLPTAGVTDAGLILNNVRQAAPSSVRLFCFGVGDDVDTSLLDTLGRELRGVSAYVRPGQSVDEEVGSFYAKIATPVLADVDLEVRGVRVEDIYPHPLPDLFAGTQLLVVGRYEGSGPARVTLSGEVNGRPQSFQYEVAFARGGGDDFLPSLWATRKVGHLLNRIRLYGESKELVDQVVELSIRYGIITPYTSFLVQEPEEALSRAGRESIARRELEALASEPSAPVYGATAVTKAQTQHALEDAQSPLSPALADEGGPSRVAVVGDRAFVWRDGTWLDTLFDVEEMQAIPVTVGSDAFFQLLREHPDAGRYFALGERVIVVLGGRAYQSIPGVPDEGISATATGTEQIRVELEAQPTAGPAPLAVQFLGRLVGGPDDNREFYCPSLAWDFGDGTSQFIQPECPEPPEGKWPVQREFRTEHEYSQPGTYRARVAIEGVWSPETTIELSTGSGHNGATSLLEYLRGLIARLIGPSPE
ncbi:MAG: VWA domain-containing protein [Anaerolineae bacterium]|nr:VWA domain-containing protein [Anaerolineae bacterium]